MPRPAKVQALTEIRHLSENSPSVAILAQVVSKTEVIETDSGLAVLRVGLADSSGSIMALAFGYRAEVLDKQLEFGGTYNFFFIKLKYGQRNPVTKLDTWEGDVENCLQLSFNYKTEITLISKSRDAMFLPLSCLSLDRKITPYFSCFGVIVSIREKYEYEKLEISLTIVDRESKCDVIVVGPATKKSALFQKGTVIKIQGGLYDSYNLVVGLRGTVEEAGESDSQRDELKNWFVSQIWSDETEKCEDAIQKLTIEPEPSSNEIEAGPSPSKKKK